MTRKPIIRAVVLWALSLGALFWLAACGGTPPPQVDTPFGITGPDGKIARTVDYEWPNLEGEGVKTSAPERRGKVLLVSVFATWCATCAEQLSELDQLVHGEQPVENLAVIAVSVDLKPREFLPPFIDYWRLKIPVVLADAGTLHGDTPFGKISTIPTTFLMDPAGRHLETLVGTIPTAYLKRRVRELSGEDQ